MKAAGLNKEELIMEIVIASAVTVGTMAIIEGVKHACKKHLERMNRIA